MRRLVIVLAVVAGVIVLAVILFASLFNVNRYRPQIEAEMQKTLNRPVTLGTLHLRLFPFSVKVDGLTIQESPAFTSGRPFATAQEVYVSAGLFSLLHGQPEIHSVTLQRPQLELIKNGAGVWNFSNLGSAGQSSSSGQSLGQLTLSSVKITDGQIAVTDQKAKT